MTFGEWIQKLKKQEQLVQKIREQRDIAQQRKILKMDWLEYMPTIVLPRLRGHAGTKDLAKYAAFHPLIGSTPLFFTTPEFDLPENQIVEFTKTLLDVLTQANEIGILEWQ